MRKGKGNIIQNRLIYQRYIKPFSWDVEKIITKLIRRDVELIDKITLAYQWVRDNIANRDKTNFCVEATLKEKSGTCLAQSILLCSMLRRCGLNERSVFVVIFRPTDDCGDALSRISARSYHASTLVFVDSDCFFLDTTQKDKLPIKPLPPKDISEDKILVMFNDKLATVFARQIIDTEEHIFKWAP